MNLTQKVRRTRQRLCLAPEVLEDRVVLSAGQGSTFAIMPGTVTTPGTTSSVKFTMSSAMFATPKKNGDILLGIDIAAATLRRPARRRRSSPRSSRSRTPRVRRSRFSIRSITPRSPRPINWEHPDLGRSGEFEGSERDGDRELHGAGRGAGGDDRHVPGRLLSPG